MSKKKWYHKPGTLLAWTVFVCCVLSIIIHQFANPELTYTQVFLDRWWLYPFILASLWVILHETEW
jgi:hypothetical protein